VTPKGLIATGLRGEGWRPDVIRVPRAMLRRRLAGVEEHLETPLYRDAYALVVSSGATSVLGIIYWTLAARLYSIEQVGLGSAAIAAMTFLSGLAQLSLRGALVRFVPVAGASTGRFIVGAYAASVLASVAMGAVFFAGISRWAPGAAFLVRSPGMALWFLFSTMAWSIFVLQDSAFTGLRQAVWVPFENAAFAAGKIVLLVVLAASNPVWGILWSWTLITPVVLVAVNILIFGRLVPAHERRTASAAMTISPGLVARFVAGDYAGSLFESFSTSFLPILVVSLAGATANAYFYVAWMVAYSLDLVAISMATSLTVEGAGYQIAVYELSRRMLVQMARLLVPAVVLVVAVAPLLLTVLGEEYAEGGTLLLRLLALAVIPYAINTVFFSTARIRRRTGEIVLVQGAIAATVIGLSYVLLPRYGVPGVGAAWLTAQSAVAVVLLATRLRPVILPGFAAGDWPSETGPRAGPEHPFVHVLFERFEAAGISWSLLRWPSEQGTWSGDMDLLVAPHDRERLERELRAAGFVRLPGYGRGTHRFWIAFEPRTCAWIEFDLVTEMAWGAYGQFTLRADPRCLGSSTDVAGVPRLGEGDAFWALLLHCLLDKHEISTPHGGQLQALARLGVRASGLRDAIVELPPGWTDERVRQLVDRGEWPELLALSAPLAGCWRHAEPGAWLGRVARGSFMRALERPLLFARRRGISVALLGPDGAGKSTLARAIESTYCLPARRVYMGLWQRGPEGDRGVSPMSGLAPAARPLTAWWRYVVGVYHRARGRLVVFDRYTYDALVPPRGPLVWLKRPYFWFLAHSCPAPDLILLLDAPGTLLHGRKGESDPELLEADRAHYRALVSRIANVLVLDASQPFEQLRSDAVDRIWRRQMEVRFRERRFLHARRVMRVLAELLEGAAVEAWRWPVARARRALKRRRWVSDTPALVAEVSRLPEVGRAGIALGDEESGHVRATEAGLTIAGMTSGSRELLLKIAWTAEAEVGLERERCALDAISRDRATPPEWTALLPNAVCTGEVRGRPFVIQTRLPGRPGAAIVRPDNAPALVAAAAHAIRVLHDASMHKISMDTGILEDWVDRPLALVGSLLGGGSRDQPAMQRALERIRLALHESLAGRSLSVCTIHGDLWLGNVLFAEDGRSVSGIIDWGLSAQDALPVHDLLHLDLYTARVLGARDVGSIICDRLRRHPNPAEPMVVPALARAEEPDGRTAVTLYWLRQVSALGAFDEYAHNRLWVAANVARVLRCLADDD
jgi:O-antigen/teichoic acid export membrane protein/thymidylate kinase